MAASCQSQLESAALLLPLPLLLPLVLPQCNPFSSQATMAGWRTWEKQIFGLTSQFKMRTTCPKIGLMSKSYSLKNKCFLSLRVFPYFSLRPPSLFHFGSETGVKPCRYVHLRDNHSLFQCRCGVRLHMCTHTEGGADNQSAANVRKWACCNEMGRVSRTETTPRWEREKEREKKKKEKKETR